jgi:glc operon protein GlcG
MAYSRASQVRLTGMKTGECENELINGEIAEQTYGIKMPDLIYWE